MSPLSQTLLHYWLQPIFHIGNNDINDIVAHEFLCRWGHDKPWIERDNALLKALYDCEQLPFNESLHINLGPAAIISLSPHLVEPVLERFGRQLVLEWTEEYSKKGTAEIVAKRLKYWRRKFGIQISIDDFGAGQDGVSRVLLTEPDSVKIDGDLFRSSLIRNSHANNILRRMCDWLIDINTPIIIEYIETPNELAFAQHLGASMGQGFLWNHLATNFYHQQNERILDIRNE